MKQGTFTAFFILSLFFANAQSDTAKKEVPEVKIKLELSVTQIDKILQALANQPYKDVADIIAVIYNNAARQLQVEPPKKEEPKKKN